MIFRSKTVRFSRAPCIRRNACLLSGYKDKG